MEITMSEAFVARPVVFERFCFDGAEFPRCDFDQPDAVRALIGPYETRASFFDAAGKPVSQAAKPGRYAAVVEIRHGGKVSKRFATLCRADAARTGVDGDVMESRRAEIVPPAPDKWAPPPPGDAHDAVIATGLFDLTALKRAGKPLPADTLITLDRQWWVEFKRRYYGLDKLYPDAFVSPHLLEGDPAPVVRDGSLAEAGMKPDAVERIDRAFAEWVRETHIGCGLVVVRRGVKVIDRAWGAQSSGPNKGEPFTPETRAPLMSTTKFLTAILLSEFMDQGLIGIDDPVERHVPALRGVPVSETVTVRDLFLHTAGFTGHWGDMLHDLEEVVADLYPTLEVHKVHRYQGVGHALAGKIMESISGEVIPRLFDNHLFGPLGLKDMASDRTCYGSWGTARDLAVIGQMMLNGGAYGDRLFTGVDSIWQLMPIRGRDRFEPDRSVRWGVGSKLPDSDGLSESHYGHSGAGGCFLMVDPEHEMVFAHTRFDEGDYTDYLRRRGVVFKAIFDAMEGGA